MADEFIATFEIKEEQKMTANFEMGNNGTKEHDKLLNRNLPEQHPISSITGLTEALEERVVNNPTITITQGGETKGSFTLNQNSDTTISLDAGGGGGSGTTTFFKNNTGTTLDTQLTIGNDAMIFKNGLLLEPTEDYSVSGSVITFVTALVSTDKIAVRV